MSSTICKACNIISNGMINIYSHPNDLDLMFKFVSEIEVIENDYLCISCYDNLKIAYNFKKKCVQSDILRRSQIIKIEKEPPEGKHGSTQSTKNQNQISIKDETEIDEIINETLEEPIKTSETPSDFECSECFEIFKDEISFTKHLDEMHSIETFDLVETGDDLEIDAEEQQSSSPTKKRRRGRTTKYPEDDIFETLTETQCEFCFLKLKTITERTEHEETHKLEEKPYSCNFDKCQSKFKEKFGLRNHARIHTDNKRFNCKFCNQRFHQRGNKVAHERLHTGEKPFLCPHCGKAFSDNGNLKTHIRFHTGERPYKCQDCDKSFKTHYSHKVHTRSHTLERPYLCSECGKGFSSSGKLLIHKRIHSGVRPYKCTKCSSAFIESSGLKRHLKIHG